ncbi:MAG TPA: crossover junction endodeoxyribonuclease RuvC [Aggregatilineales bacterium]|nr:crossover junction endodeoxyribonuclease RuvC [Aggregatilineales bacterium]
MLILGIDPGTATTGYGLVRQDDSGDGSLVAVAYGVISTQPDHPMAYRLNQIYRHVAALITEYKPDEAAIEEMFFGKNVTAAITVAQGRGVALLAMEQAGLKIREYKPAQVKQTIAGYGNAPKPQMQEMVRILLNLAAIPKPDDAADALAIAITALQSSRWERLVDSPSS